MPDERTPMDVDGRAIRYFAQRLSETMIAGGRSYYEQGRMLDEVVRGRYWARWPGVNATSYMDWCWKVLGCRSRRAEMLRANYLKISAMNVADDTLVRAIRLGWTKLAHVLKLATDEITLLKWIDKIENEGLTETALRALTSPKPVDDGTAEQNTREKCSFRLVFEDKEALDVFLLGLKAIQKRYDPEMGWGRAAALMATNYAGTLPRDDEGGAAVELNDLLAAIEDTYRVKLVVADDAAQPAPRYPGTVDAAVRNAALEM